MRLDSTTVVVASAGMNYIHEDEQAALPDATTHTSATMEQQGSHRQR